MPLLPKERDRFPDDVFAAEGPPWNVAHVRSRQEKSLSRYLEQHRIAFFLPQSTREIQRGGRRLRSHLPVFPGYVFYRGDDRSRSLVLSSNVIANLIEVPDQAQLHSELVQIADLLDRGASLTPVHTFALGEPVRIKEGVFAGYSGIVEREKSSSRLIVLISLIGKAVSVEFGSDVLLPVR